MGGIPQSIRPKGRFAMNNALITGVTGQGGAHLCKYLLEKGYRVFGGCRRMGQTDLWRLQELGVLNNPSFRFTNMTPPIPYRRFIWSRPRIRTKSITWPPRPMSEDRSICLMRRR